MNSQKNIEPYLGSACTFCTFFFISDYTSSFWFCFFCSDCVYVATHVSSRSCGENRAVVCVWIRSLWCRCWLQFIMPCEFTKPYSIRVLVSSFGNVYFTSLIMKKKSSYRLFFVLHFYSWNANLVQLFINHCLFIAAAISTGHSLYLVLYSEISQLVRQLGWEHRASHDAVPTGARAWTHNLMITLTVKPQLPCCKQMPAV